MREKRHRVGGNVGSRGRRPFELGELLLRRIGGREPQRTRERVEHGMERAALVICGTSQRLDTRAFAGDRDLEFLSKARLSDSGLAVDEHRAAALLPPLGPGIEEQSHLLPPPHERRQPLLQRNLHPAADRLRAQHSERLDRTREPAERRDRHRLAREPPLYQPVRALADEHGVGRSDALQPSCDVGRLAERQPLVATGARDLTNHDDPGVDADPHREIWTLSDGGTLGVQLAQRLDDCETALYGPLRIVLAGKRESKIDEQTVAQVLRDVPLERTHSVGAGPLEAVDELAEILGIHALAERRRSDQIAKDDRQQPPFCILIRPAGRIREGHPTSHVHSELRLYHIRPAAPTVTLSPSPTTATRQPSAPPRANEPSARPPFASPRTSTRRLPRRATPPSPSGLDTTPSPG